ncbi:MAG: cadherin repeat domain-containing protein [Methanobrevibacter sp.]|nr:cadherin repeat domain-containing protein [Methanobrevibacter sp.]
MKKIIGILLFLAAFVFSADYKPFNFESIPQDSASQQDQFDYMLQYKLYGHDFIKMGNDVRIPDKSGWNGTVGNITSNARLTLGGPILANGSISMGDGPNNITGPVRSVDFDLGNVNGSKIASPVCLSGTANTNALSAIEDHKTYSFDTDICKDSVPAAPTNLYMPIVDWDNLGADVKLNDIVLSGNDAADTIFVPKGEGAYKILIDKIQFGLGGTNASHLYVKMQDGGRLTQIFVKNFIYGNHATIQVVYDTDSGSVVLNQDQYRGNLMFYSNNVISFDNMDYAPIQGSFISTDSIFLGRNVNISGQLLTNKLEIGNDIDGKNFRFVKFDPDTIDVKLDKYGGLRENDSTVIIPIELSDTATIAVYFRYCFDLKDGVTVEDFIIPPTFPVCGTDQPKEVSIPIGSKTPSDPIKVNVKVDTLTENEYLVIKIDSISGAILPDGKTEGELKIKIIDAPVGHVEFDTTKTYKFEETKLGEVDVIKILNGTENTRFHLDSAYTDRYELDSLTGKLTLIGESLDYEKAAIDVIKVTLTDTGNVSVTRNIPISVIDVNEAPTIDDITTNLPENLIHPFMVEKLVAKDPDTKTAFTQNVFSMLEGDTSLFRVDSDGEIWAKKTFDYETDQKTYTLKVLVQDKTNPALKDSAIVTVNITNSNDGPKFDTHDTTFHVKENEPFKDSVKATDQDGDKITYSIVGTVPFKIDSNGVITSTRTFDYEKETGFTFKVVADDGKAKDTMTVNIIVDNVNEPVHTKDTTFVVDEGKTGEIGKVKGEDEDGKPVKFSCDDSVHYSIDINTGVLRLVDPFDYEVTKSDTVKVFVTDGVFTDTAIVVVNVNNVNEPPVLQPNDSLTVPENCKSCIVGIITAVDPDSDKVIYEVKEPGFTIDSNGVLKLTDPLDYEKTPEVKITVIAKDSSGAADTATYVIKVTDINEPVHVQDTTCSVKENYTGKVCKIDAWDEDKTTPKYTITDTTNYSIDSTGTITIKTPIDYEKKTKDTVTVIVTDGEFSDTAQVIIRVLDEPEDVKITEWDHNPPPDTVKTNDPDHEYKWTICEGDSCITHYDNPRIHKDTTIKVCNDKKTVCDSIVVLFNDAPPVVTLTNAKSTDALIDYITIEEQKDDKIYVNKKDNELKVTVRDTVHKTEKTFPIDVKLDTVHVSSKNVVEYNYLIDESVAKVTPIGNGLYEVKEVVKVDGRNVTLTKIVDKKMNPVDTIQTVTYTVKQDGKELTITYKTDNLTGQRIGDYQVSYKIDSCTTVSYYLGDNKKITKNEEGNIAYTVSYEYTDDYGNKATSKVDIIFDDIPPVVEILTPYEMEKFNTNAIPVEWTVNGVKQDTLTLQRLEKGINSVIRRYVDKAGNVAADTIMVFMNEAKDIDITLVHPVTMVDQDKVDSFYSEGNKYDPKKPYTVTTLKGDDKPDPVGIGFKIDVALPSVSPTGNVSTLSDIIKNDKIPVDDKGNVVGASNLSIPVEEYINENCTDDFRQDYNKNGTNIPLYNVKYNLHLWIYTSNANYVNDFEINYDIDSKTEANEASIANFVIDWIPEKDGNVKAKNQHSLGTGAYLVKLYSKSTAIYRCGFKNQKAGDKITKKEYNLKSFGYKRPNK